VILGAVYRSRAIISIFTFHLASHGLSLVSPTSPSVYMSYEFLQVDSRRYHHRTFTCLCTPAPSYPLSRQTSPFYLYLSHKMVTGPPNRARPQQASREREGQSLPHVRTSVRATTHSTHVALQYAPPPCPRIPRLVSRYAEYDPPAVDSQFQVNASHVQKPLSLIVPVSLSSILRVPIPQLAAL